MSETGLTHLSDPEVQTILSLIGDGVISTDGSGSILLFNHAAETMFGYSASEVVGQPVELLVPQRYRDHHEAAVASFAAAGGRRPRLMGVRREVVGRRKSGEEFPVEATLSRQDAGSGPLLTVVIRDITERRRQEEQQQLIAEELTHRIRNLMTIVTSMVSLTASGSEDVKTFRDALLSRLMAISRANDSITAGRWQDTPLTALLDAELTPFRTSRTAVILKGEKVTISAKVAFALGLAVHELATNAAKYGALSRAGGRLELSWSTDGAGQLLLSWKERGGPPVAEPHGSGFGTQMIRRTLASLRGEASIHYRKEGLECTLRIPSQVGRRAGARAAPLPPD
jgi:PAS domain S-box-containing protein